MRKLIITRGLPGSGKTYTLDQLGLSDFTISLDDLRLILASPILTSNGRTMINQNNNEKIWNMALEFLETRMEKGETIVIDATHQTADSFTVYRNLSDKYRYDFVCLDFSEIPQDVSMWNNEGRAEYRIISEHVMKKIQDNLEANSVPEDIYRIVVKRDRSHLKELRDWLEIPVVNLDHKYKKIVHIGDLQGTYQVLMDFLDQHSDGKIRDDYFYIFVGDICDRGIENGKIMRWAIDNLIGRDNVVVIQGNHEKHLLLEGLGMPAVSSEFELRTLPQLKAKNISKEELLRFYDELKDIFFYQFHGQKVMVTHGGLSTVPNIPWQVPSYQTIKGTGFYEEPVDAQFEQHAPPGWLQVHGHRNSHYYDIIATPRSVNLESSVEYGGNLRCMILDENGMNPIETPNKIFKPFRERPRKKSSTLMPAWMAKEDDGGIFMPQSVYDEMVAHNGVRVTPMDDMPYIESFQFSKKVFFEKNFDDLTTKARGLFVNKNDLKIVARSYEKFFNIGENETTSLDSLKNSLVFPLVGFEKENGFLGITGYDHESNTLFTSSKSRSEGVFADNFRDIFNEKFPQKALQDDLKRLLRDWDASMIFEVIDPVKDPHIVEYDAAKIVLLDVVRRSINFEKMDYQSLEAVAQKYDLEVKKRFTVFKNWQAFEGWHKKASQNMKTHIEGYVFEDASGYQVKFKTPWYSFWKICRSYKDYIVKCRSTGKAFSAISEQFLESRNLGFTADLAKDFSIWANEQSNDILSLPLIQVRNMFERDMKLNQTAASIIENNENLAIPGM